MPVTAKRGASSPYFLSASASGASSTTALNFAVCSWLDSASTAKRSAGARSGITTCHAPSRFSRRVVSPLATTSNEVKEMSGLPPSGGLATSAAALKTRSATSLRWLSRSSPPWTP